jgi:DHA1 family bicyclomycin/chloramphenicol resistance-like MFS transporter
VSKTKIHKSQNSVWKFVIVVGILQMMQPLTVDPYLASGPQISSDLNVDSALIQLSLSALTIGFALGQFIAGPISDSIGRRRPLLASGILYVAVTLMNIFAWNIEVFMTTRFLQGLAGSAVAVIGNAIIRDRYSGQELMLVFGKLFLIQGAAWFIGPFFGSQILAVTNWRGISGIISIFAVAGVMMAFKFLGETLAHEDRREDIFKGMGARFIHVFSDRIYVGLMLVSMTSAIAVWTFLSCAPFVYGEQFGLEPMQFGLFMTAHSFSGYVGAQLVSYLARKYQAKWLLTAAFAGLIIFGFAVYFAAWASAPLALVAILICGFFLAFGMTLPTIGALSLAGHGEEAGTAASVLAVVTSASTALAGPVFTSLDKSNFVAAATMATTVAITGLIFMLTVVRPKSAPNLT